MELSIGAVVDGRYKIEAVIGRGGMGTVYKATHATIGKSLALKILKQEFSKDESFASRFQREAFATGKIQHQNVVPITDFGVSENGVLYLAMEYIDGTPLSQKIHKNAPLDPKDALSILKHMLSGLGAAHEKNVIHRDVKPDNVLITPKKGDDHFAMILDFGVAKLVGTGANHPNNNLTAIGTAVGTPVYVSPEQALADSVDGRADLYSATVVLFEMLTKTVPFFNKDPSKLLQMHVMDEIPTLASKRPEVDIPDSIEEIIRIGMAKDPEERFNNAQEYSKTIEDVLSKLSNPKRKRAKPSQQDSPKLPKPRRERTSKKALWNSSASLGATEQSRGNKKVATIAAGAVFALLAGLLVLFFFSSEEKSENISLQGLASRHQDYLSCSFKFNTECVTKYDKLLNEDKEAARSEGFVFAQLEAAATSHPGMGVRGKARRLAEKHKIPHDSVASLILDLQDISACSKRRRIVRKLRDKKDKRAIGAIEGLLERYSGPKRRKKIRCLEKTAREALYLLKMNKVN